MNADLLNLAQILDPENPVRLRASARPWVVESLTAVGWTTGERVPGGLPDYFSEAMRLLELQPTPESIKTLCEMEEVRITLQSALRRVHELDHLNEEADARIRDMLGDEPAQGNDAVNVIRNAAKQAIAAQIQAKKVPEEEDFSDLEPPAKEQPVAMPVCPRCHWDTGKPYIPVEMTQEDQRNYLIYVLGGPAFMKSFTLWGGLCTVTMKTNSNREEDLFTEQYAKDYTSGQLSVPILAQRRYDQYHAALGVAKIQFSPAVNRPPIPVPSIWSSEFEPADGDTRLARFMKKWYEQCITSVELQNELTAQWKEFNTLLTRLQQELHNPDFLKGATSV